MNKVLWIVACLSFAVPDSWSSPVSKSAASTILGASQGSILLYNGLGSRNIPRFTSSVSPDVSIKTPYAHVFFNRPSDSEYLAIVRTGKVNRVAVTSIRNGSNVYEHWIVNLLDQDIDVLRSRWSREFPKTFHNIEPYLVNDKLTFKTKGIVPFDSMELDSVTGKIQIHIQFFGDVSKARQLEILREKSLVQVRSVSDQNIVLCDSNEISSLAVQPEIQRITEYQNDQVLVNRARDQIRLNAAQPIDVSRPFPDSSWLNDMCAYTGAYYGRGVWVAVYDTGIDTAGDSSTVSDFRNRDPNGKNSVRKVDPYPASYWEIPDSWSSALRHGTHVAGIIGGNGWNSQASGGTRYLWRGIAPKVDFISQPFGYNAWYGHVNNHSHTFDNVGYYNIRDREADEVIFHHSVTHVKVAAAANSGVNPGNGGAQRGYYSLLVNSKNAIVVGATTSDTATRASFSSMGPTRDGRIKPDVVAPGASYNFPQRLPVNQGVDIDYIRFVRAGGIVVKAYEFNLGTEGWGIGYGVHDVSSSGGILKFKAWNHQCDIVNTTVSGYTTNPDDSLIIRYRFRHPQIPGKVNKIYAGLGWNANSGGSLLWFTLQAPDTVTYQTFRVRLRDLYDHPLTLETYGIKTWPTSSNVGVSSLGFVLASDTAVRVLSTNILGSAGPAYWYDHGTSMAAPVVSGIAALMLEKWKTEVVPGADLHTQGPWNSTVKAILVHAATDLVKTEPDYAELHEGVAGVNPDHCWRVGWECTRESVQRSFVKYPKGPDYATGYGLVNADKALDYTDSSRVIQDSVAQLQSLNYKMQVPGRLKALRITLAWDDLPGSLFSTIDAPKLVNDLNVRVIDPNGDHHLPWNLDALPQNIVNDMPPADGLDPIDSADVKPAWKGVNHRDNLEVVDVESEEFLPSGEWTIRIEGESVMSGTKQDYSLVTDYKAVPAP